MVSKMSESRPNAGAGEIVVIGAYEPSEWTIDAVEQEFRKLPFLAECCRREKVSVRIPQGIEVPENNMNWHQDGGGADGTTKHMVVWASETPTELKTSDGHPFISPVGSVVWFDNTRAFHRQPRNTDETSRWFVAIRCSGAIA